MTHPPDNHPEQPGYPTENPRGRDDSLRPAEAAPGGLDDFLVPPSTRYDDDLELDHPAQPGLETSLPGLAANPADEETITGRNGWKIKKSTADLYRGRVARVWRDTANNLRRRDLTTEEASVLVTPMDVVNRLIERANSPDPSSRLSTSSWFAYRSALLFDFASHEDRPEYAAALHTLETYTPPDQLLKEQRREERRRRTGRNKISREHLTALLNELGATQTRGAGWGARVQQWLLAGMATGIRPGEWEFTRWADEEKTLLLAPNSKGKADEPATIRDRIAAEANSRHAPLSGARRSKPAPQMRAIPVDTNDRIYVDKHLASIADAAAQGMSFENYYNTARKRLFTACNALWGGRYTYSLYVARHQFSADLKASDTSPDEIARLMGHLNTRAANRHYAKARASHHRGAAMSQQEAQAAQATDQAAPVDTAAADSYTTPATPSPGGA